MLLTRRQSAFRLQKRRLLVAGAAFLLPLVLSGCGQVNGSAASVSQLRIIDASPDTGGLDIYAGTTAIAYNLGFGTTTSYVPFTPATYTLTADAASTRTVLTSTRASLAVGKQYTLLISNNAANLQSQVLTDQSTPSPTGQISLRFLDEAIAVGPVDLYLVPAGSTLNKVNPVRTGVAFGANTGYINVPTGTYTLYVVAAGTTISATTVSAYVGPATAYSAGSARTIVLLDTQIVTSPSVQVVTLSDYDSATATQ